MKQTILDQQNGSHSPSLKNPFNIIVIVAALGYFVDIYDLILFSIVRRPSLVSLGITDDKQLLDIGINLLNTQMVGMLAGGIIWGILGDKKGRLSVLFGTIILYSLANIANGFVQDLTQYYILRFIAGVGLAGELGVGITLVSEVMTKETRGYGTSIVSGIGIAGAVAGFLVSDLFDWRMAYWVGGGLGLLLLILRISVYESGMFSKLKHQQVKRGSFLSLFENKKRFLKYLYCILIGVPVWYVIGILVTFSPEFSKNVLHVVGEINAGKSIMYHYIGASLGSFLLGILSQQLRSRKKSLGVALIVLLVFEIVYFASFNVSATFFYIVIFVLGLAQGYWAVFVTTASEQFGTNLRATVTTTAPNFVRGSTLLMTTLFKFMNGVSSIGMLLSGILVCSIVMLGAFWSLYKLEETYHKDLDYIEAI